jgi:hypothetical protein
MNSKRWEIESLEKKEEREILDDHIITIKKTNLDANEFVFEMKVQW